jgi:hypothetical protein
MRKLIAIACAGIAAAMLAVASDSVWTVTSNPTNAALAVSATSRPVLGELDSVFVYWPAGVSGVVSVVVSDPYDTARELVVANNTNAVGYRVFIPRIAATGTHGYDGASALTVTNAGERLVLAGDTVKATISAVSVTSAVVRVRVKVKK